MYPIQRVALGLSLPREIFKQTNNTIKLESCTTDQFPRPAKRPKYAVMDQYGTSY